MWVGRVDPDRSPPLGDPYRLEPEVVDVEALGGADARRLRQRSVEAVQPRVVRASNDRSGAGRPGLAERRRPVTAHVEKSAQLALAVANQQHRKPADDDRRPLLGRRQLVGDADAHPFGPEHALQLVAMERLVGVPRRWERARRSDAGRIRDVSKRDGYVRAHVTLPTANSSECRSLTGASIAPMRSTLATKRSPSDDECITDNVHDSVFAHGALNTPLLCCTR